MLILRMCNKIDAPVLNSHVSSFGREYQYSYSVPTAPLLPEGTWFTNISTFDKSVYIMCFIRLFIRSVNKLILNLDSEDIFSASDCKITTSGYKFWKRTRSIPVLPIVLRPYKFSKLRP